MHPVVVFSVLDHFQRRNANQTRVIGALLGTKTGSRVEITNCFPIPHSEDDEIAVGKEVMRQVLDLQKQVNSQEDLVGWYSTTTAVPSRANSQEEEEMDEKTCLLHDFFGEEKADPLHLLVDMNPREATNYEITVKAYLCDLLSLSLKDSQGGEGDDEGEREEEAARLVACFREIAVETKTSTIEKQVLYQMCKQKKETEAGSQKNLRKLLRNSAFQQGAEESLEELVQLIGRVSDYLSKGGPDGKVDPHVVAKLSQLLNQLPKVDPAEFAKSYNKSLHDLLMVAYLSNLTRAQLAVAEKINL